MTWWEWVIGFLGITLVLLSPLIIIELLDRWARTKKNGTIKEKKP